MSNLKGQEVEVEGSRHVKRCAIADHNDTVSVKGEAVVGDKLHIRMHAYSEGFNQRFKKLQLLWCIFFLQLQMLHLLESVSKALWHHLFPLVKLPIVPPLLLKLPAKIDNGSRTFVTAYAHCIPRRSVRVPNGTTQTAIHGIPYRALSYSSGAFSTGHP